MIEFQIIFVEIEKVSSGIVNKGNGIVSFKVDCRYRCPSKTNGMAPSGTSAMLFNENKAKKKQTKQNIFFITESIFQHLSQNGPI